MREGEEGRRAEFSVENAFKVPTIKEHMRRGRKKGKEKDRKVNNAGGESVGRGQKGKGLMMANGSEALTLCQDYKKKLGVQWGKKK